MSGGYDFDGMGLGAWIFICVFLVALFAAVLKTRQKKKSDSSSRTSFSKLEDDDEMNANVLEISA